MSAMISSTCLVSSSPSPLKRRLSDRPVHPVLVNLPYPGSSPASPKKSHSRSHSTTPFVSAIRSWAEQVAPGSPNSPSKASPNSRRLSFNSVSISLSSSPRRPSQIIVPPTASSFLSLQKTPSSADDTQPFDLTALGYTNNFVHLPKTPETPEEFLELAKLRKETPKQPTTPKSASAGTRSFKAFNVLKPFRSRSKSQSGKSDIVDSFEVIPPVPPMPDQYKTTDGAAVSKKGGLTSLFPSRSKSASASKPKAIIDPAEREARRALALQQHINMATFIAGGKPSHHAHDIAKDYAKRTGQPVSLPVKIDGQYYFGQDEKDEYNPLLKEPLRSPSAASVSSQHRSHRSGRRASTTSSLGPLVREADAHASFFPPPHSNPLPAGSSGRSKGKHIPPSLPLQHSNFNATSRRHAFDDSFAPSVRR